MEDVILGQTRARLTWTDGYTNRLLDAPEGTIWQSSLDAKEMDVLVYSPSPLPNAFALSARPMAVERVHHVEFIQNDANFDSARDVVQLIVDPRRGTRDLQPNGYFIYQLNLDCAGTDKFTCSITDASGTSNVATVSIEVVREWFANHPGAISLGQGSVYYSQPTEVGRALTVATTDEARIYRNGLVSGLQKSL